MTTLLIATRNAHKVGEIRAILGPEFGYLTLQDVPGAPEVTEDAPTFAGNATKKAVQLAKFLAETDQTTRSCSATAFVLADDSGLEVDALHGAPGVHSARFAALDRAQAGNSTTAENNAKLQRLLENVPAEKRQARFRCVIALTPVIPAQQGSASPVCALDEYEVQTELFEGACEGRIGFVPRGRGGFGYDPWFTPEGFDQTFGELGEEIKNRLSHRAKALEKLRVWFSAQGACVPRADGA